MDRGADIFLIVWVIGVLLTWPPWIWWSVRSRKVRGEPLMPRPPANAAFCERGASGWLQNNPLAAARNCLQVAIHGDQLWITPTFPFNLIAPYGLMGLEYRVDRRKVMLAEKRRIIFGTIVYLELPRPDGRSRRVDLKLRDPDGFLKALKRP